MKNILLIEPNTLLARLYQQILATKDYRVAHVTSAQAAIDAADSQTPDVVVLEIQLPKHNGIEFLHEFRSYPEWGNVPVILHTFVPPDNLSAVAEPLKRDLGITAILYKPKTSLDQLLQAVQEQTATL